MHPTILIGTSTQTGAFTEAIVRDMAAHTERPIIMPLSNPTSKCEALPADLIRWTDGRALIATGSPFAPVTHDGHPTTIAQANNALVFPGLGLGVTVARASRITDRMIAAAADAVAELSNATTRGAPLLPPVMTTCARSPRRSRSRWPRPPSTKGWPRCPSTTRSSRSTTPCGGRSTRRSRSTGADQALETGDVVLRVLVVEDQATAAEVMAAYVERVPAFEVAGLAASGADCLRLLGAGGIDLILLDIQLPDMSGLEVLRRIRAAGSTVDVIVVTQARDLSVVQAAVSFGSMQYLIKPFTFAAVRQKLERYQEYRSMLTENNLMLVQQEVDRLLHTMRDPVENDLPKGINPDSLQVVVSALRSRPGRGAVRRDVRGRGGRRVRLVPGHGPALPGVPGHLGHGRAQRALPPSRASGGGVPAGAAGCAGPIPLLTSPAASIAQDHPPCHLRTIAMWQGRGGGRCADPEGDPGRGQALPASPRAGGASPASCSRSRPR